MIEPVHFTSQLKELKGGEGEIIFTATIDNGWHVYSTNLGEDGPISATFNPVKMEGVQTIGKLQPRGKEQKAYDKLFEMELRFFEKAVTFVQKVRFTKADYEINCYLEYGACNDQSCLPPSTVDFKKKGKTKEVAAAGKGNPMGGPGGDRDGRPGPPPDGMGGPGGPGGHMPPHADGQMPPHPEDMGQMGPNDAPDIHEGNDAQESGLEADSIKEGLSDIPAAPGTSDGNVGHEGEGDLWQPVVSELKAMGGSDNIIERGLLDILLGGFLGGLLAVCMPCIWPIIPMTVSFFLKRAKTDKKKGIRDAITYGLSIIAIYLGLGLLVTAIFGSDTLNVMSTSAVFNIFLFLLLVVFALSFFGWFEISLPESWANAVDSKASQTSGLISIFLMAFTLVLVSFSCTAPIIGLLLVETTTSGNWLAPAIGMLGFAIALALPFTLFALFPSWLKRAPKSGSWMNTLKVVLGFIELAFALKFFSVADLAYGWHLLDREVFLSLWIVIFALLGAYLCGWLKFQSDEIAGSQRAMPVLCIMGGLVSLAFAVYMIPGLWGAPCKAVSAFAPPINTQDFNLNTKVVEAKYTSYEEGMAAARAQGKPVLIDFTGFGCVNCRKMEAAVWTDPTVADLLTKDFVLISLYVDDKAQLPEPMEVTDHKGNAKTLRTVGAKWSYLQSHKFGANAQPFYVMLDNNGRPLTGSRAYNEDVNGYIQFLKQGLKQYKN